MPSIPWSCVAIYLPRQCRLYLSLPISPLWIVAWVPRLCTGRASTSCSSYCNVNTGTETHSIAINCWVCNCDSCYHKIDSFFLREYEMKKREQHLASPAGPNKKMDPIIPFVQEFLSHGKVLELGTHCCKDHCDFSSSFETAHELSYVPNIVTSKQPHLKHLKVSGTVQLEK